LLSFIIPAHNEEALLGETLRVLHASAERLGEDFEIVVVDDSSTDATVAVARAGGARVVSIKKRHIAAARNAGAQVARGDPLFFVDADTHVYYETLFAALVAIRQGAVGGGAAIRLREGAPLWARAMFALVLGIMLPLHWAAGCFVFVRRVDFDAVRGFNERYFAAEEIVLSRELKRRGRFVIVKPSVLTSDRKAHLYSPFEFPKLIWHAMIRGPRALQSREGLDMWYDGRR
jgi:glycosyltransferase involved in cell wall biosynthesis